MRKKLDITEKLSFDEKPVLVIRGEEIVIHDDAPTMLKVMELLDGEMSVGDILKTAKLIFGEEGFLKLEKLKLGFKDFVIATEMAIDLITGETEGEL